MERRRDKQTDSQTDCNSTMICAGEIEDGDMRRDEKTSVEKENILQLKALRIGDK